MAGVNKPNSVTIQSTCMLACATAMLASYCSSHNSPCVLLHMLQILLLATVCWLLLQPRTCGNMQPVSKPNNVRFSCITPSMDVVYDSAAANVAPPSVDACCKVSECSRDRQFSQIFTSVDNSWSHSCRTATPHGLTYVQRCLCSSTHALCSTQPDADNMLLNWFAT
jgi:hypothetical protein